MIITDEDTLPAHATMSITSFCSARPMLPQDDPHDPEPYVGIGVSDPQAQDYIDCNRMSYVENMEECMSNAAFSTILLWQTQFSWRGASLTIFNVASFLGK